MSTEDTDTAVALDSPAPPVAIEVGDLLMFLVHPDKTRVSRRIELVGEPVRIGRLEEKNNLVVPHNTVSGEHARLDRIGGRWRLADLDSKNGTFVNGSRVDGTVILQSQDRVAIGPALLKFFSGTDVEKQLIDEIVYQGEHDAVTGVYNRHIFNQRLETEIVRARRHHAPLSLLLLDFNDFKKVNDTYGHAAADKLLRETAVRLQARVRPEDTFARYGGDEFAVILTHADLQGASTVANDLRRLATEVVVPHELGPIRTSISCGVAQWTDADVDADAFVQRCDASMYEDKRGRKRRAE